MDPITRTELSMAVAQGEVELKPEFCEDLFFQVTLDSSLQGPRVARAVGIDRRTFNRYQNYQSQPTLQKALEILEELGWKVKMEKCETP